MNGNIKVLTMMLLSLLLSGSLSGNPVQANEKKAKERLAVLDLEAKYGVDKGLAEALSVIVRDKLHSFGDYQVMSKGDIQAVASREQLKQVIGCDDDGSQCLLDFGRAIGTRFMVAGDISKIGSTYTVSLRMLDTQGETAGVTNRVNEDCKCDDDALIGTVRDVAAKLVGKPTTAAIKKAEEEKKLTVEKKKTEETVEKNKAVEVEKQRLAAEIEKQKKETKPATQETKQKLIVAENKPVSLAIASPSLPTSKAYADPTTGMEFVYIPGGCFKMGQTEEETAQLIKDEGKDLYDKRYSRELPQHEVCVDSFYMGKFEVTLGEWQKFIKATNYRTDAEKNTERKGCGLATSWQNYREGLYWNDVGFSQSDRHPVGCISYNDAIEFIVWLGRQNKTNYRLPTEAEWEYAARAGTTDAAYGMNVSDNICKYANFSDRSRDLSKLSLCNDGYVESAPVGSFQPNKFGLYDMLGNVYEWTSDWFEKGYYGKSPKDNPSGAPPGNTRIFRGGGWSRKHVRFAMRNDLQPWFRITESGFRLVHPAQTESLKKENQ